MINHRTKGERKMFLTSKREIIWRTGIRLMQLVTKYRALKHSELWAFGRCMVFWAEQ